MTIHENLTFADVFVKQNVEMKECESERETISALLTLISSGD